jgi:small subunit ribosomal protein S17e
MMQHSTTSTSTTVRQGSYEGEFSLGKVRPEQVKKVARELIVKYRDRFTTNFEENKKALIPLAHISSPRLKNRIAGYVTRLMVISQHAKLAETEEETPISEEEAE